MSDADALLDAIWADPEDDTPRLVYADWLQEHSYADYADLIRLSCRLNREIQYPKVRADLRLRRHLLRQKLVKEHERAFPEFGPGLGNDGIPSVWLTVNAGEFLKNWRHWWPFIRPKCLNLIAVSGRESEVGNCEYLLRVVALECEGTVTSSRGHEREEVEWQAVSGQLLHAFATSTKLERLTALKVEPIEATASELLSFCESHLAARLEDLKLWVQFPDGSREDLRAHAGYVKEHVTEFVAENASRFGVQ
jgi:uncharacterized protein (TIGR02996 family)